MGSSAGTRLFVASVAGQVGSQTDPPSSASKAALINFAQCAARELAPYGVRVNALCPGMVKTALNRAVWEAWLRPQPEGKGQPYEEWAGEKVRRVVPLGRWQEPKDVAAMAVFLASARASNVTGQTVNVNGGYVMRGRRPETPRPIRPPHATPRREKYLNQRERTAVICRCSTGVAGAQRAHGAGNLRVSSFAACLARSVFTPGTHFPSKSLPAAEEARTGGPAQTG